MLGFQPLLTLTSTLSYRKFTYVGWLLFEINQKGGHPCDDGNSLFYNARSTIQCKFTEKMSGVIARSHDPWFLAAGGNLRQTTTWKESPVVSRLLAKYLWPPRVFYDSVKNNSVGLVCTHYFICMIDCRMRKGGAK
jgi:hypothetical protein